MFSNKCFCLIEQTEKEMIFLEHSPCKKLLKINFISKFLVNYSTGSLRIFQVPTRKLILKVLMIEITWLVILSPTFWWSYWILWILRMQISLAILRPFINV